MLECPFKTKTLTMQRSLFLQQKAVTRQLMYFYFFLLLGFIAESNNVAYCDSCYCSVVCLYVVCRNVHSAKAVGHSERVGRDRCGPK